VIAGVGIGYDGARRSDRKKISAQRSRWKWTRIGGERAAIGRPSASSGGEAGAAGARQRGGAEAVAGIADDLGRLDGAVDGDAHADHGDLLVDRQTLGGVGPRAVPLVAGEADRTRSIA
jgi:hypothetical protein